MTALVRVPLRDGAALALRERSRRGTFWSHVEKQPGGCWIWHGRVDAYGSTRFGNKRPARIAWHAEHGEWPAFGVSLVETCGNTLCIRPAHRREASHREGGLRYGGTQARVKQDCEWGPNAKLTREQARFVWANCHTHGAPPLLSRLLGVCLSAIYAIKYRARWRSISRHRGGVERISLRALRELVESREAEASEDHGAVLAHAAEARTA